MIRNIKQKLQFLLVLVVSIFMFDLILIKLDLFPPPSHPIGDKKVGFLDPVIQDKKGQIQHVLSPIPSFRGKEGEIIVVNERGFRSTRSMKEIIEKPVDDLILVLGDSHTMLPYGNDLTHPFILQQELRKKGLESVEVLNAGVKAYSPLQCYFLFKHYMPDLHPKVIILNLYIGNDFFDLIRVDDRPHFVRTEGDSIIVQSPVWYRYRDPESQENGLDKSRVLFVLKRLLGQTGSKTNWTRLQYLIGTAIKQDQNIFTIVRYMWDLRKATEPALWYPGAFLAQTLNQLLFFKWFPQSKTDSARSLSVLLRWMKEEYPEVILVMSPIPSPVLSGALDEDPLFRNRLYDVDLDFKRVIQIEEELYHYCREAAERSGWIFVDNLSRFQAYPDHERLFLEEDLHISPEASRLIGEEEAKVLLTIVGEAVDQ